MWGDSVHSNQSPNGDYIEKIGIKPQAPKDLWHRLDNHKIYLTL